MAELNNNQATVNTEVGISEVVSFIESNKDSQEVKALIEQYSGGGNVTAESVQSFLGTEEGKKILQPELDRYATKAIDSWKSNHLQNIIEDEMLKRRVVETPEQKALREMQERIQRIEKEKQRETLKNVALMEFGKRGLPDALTNYMIGETEESTRRNIQTLELEWKSSLERAVEERLKSSGRTPNVSPDTVKSTEPIDKSKMSYQQLVELQQHNPEMYKQIMG